jgi:hypothetical protein
MHPLLPASVSPTEAAALTGRSRCMINKLIVAGVLVAEGRVHQRIPMAAVEELIGEPVSVERWLSARTALAPRRRSQAIYNETRRDPAVA